jgi:hypothetical protein
VRPTWRLAVRTAALAQGRRRSFALRSPRTRRLLFRLPPQRRHPPRPLLTQPRPFYGHRQVQIIREALHRADQVQNAVLVPCRDQLPKQAILLACISPHSLRLRRVVPVLPTTLARPLKTFGRARPRARATMHAASPVRHRGPVTGAAVPTPCSAARGSVHMVETFAAEWRLGFLGHFRTFPPAVPRPRAPRPTLPATTACPPSFTCTCRTTTVCLPPERRR